ncbi:type VI secretion system baseplate subunit TssG [Paraburkholderia caffeinilytica]|uniref:type VI secretion system baseplate subunit TssG n=1 Tax=Paraburkholderia caffeinilytica TaxID=1761016 RepID=UPI003DA0CD39
MTQFQHAKVSVRQDKRESDEKWIDQVCANPWEYGFLALLRRMDACMAHESLGYAERPHEPVRLGQQPGLEFASSELAGITYEQGRLRVSLKGLGMFGPHGALPFHVTEIAYNRLRQEGDTTLTDFLDMFHHRYLSLFYRAWASAEATVGLDRVANEHFSFYIASLIGHDLLGMDSSPLPRHARLAAASHLVRHARNPEGLRAMLSHYFNVPVQVHEHVFRWIELESTERGNLSAAGDASIMGRGAMLGESVADRQHRFRIVLGPLDLQAYLSFIPGGVFLPALVEWVRTFVGYEFVWELELQIRAEDAPATILSDAQCLGWSSWLGDCCAGELASSLCFEPELYVTPSVC